MKTLNECESGDVVWDSAFRPFLVQLDPDGDGEKKIGVALGGIWSGSLRDIILRDATGRKFTLVGRIDTPIGLPEFVRIHDRGGEIA